MIDFEPRYVGSKKLNISVNWLEMLDRIRKVSVSNINLEAGYPTFPDGFLSYSGYGMLHYPKMGQNPLRSTSPPPPPFHKLQSYCHTTQSCLRN
jgi:hypothetical protein